MHDQPWGMDGSTFLLLYGFALALVGCAVAIASAAARRPGFRDDVPAELGTYERAYLNGGAHRVADTALAGLIAGHKVRITRRDEMAFVGPKEPEDGFQQLVRAHLNGRSGVSDLRRAVRTSGECEPLERSSRDQELLVPARARRRVLAVMALFPLLLAFGVVRAVRSGLLGRPIGMLLAELFIAGIAWWLAAVLWKHPVATRFGEAVKRRDPVPDSFRPLSGQPRRYRPFNHADEPRLDGPGPLEGAAELVAVDGLGAYPNPGIAKLLDPSRSRGGSGIPGGSGGGGCGG